MTDPVPTAFGPVHPSWLPVLDTVRAPLAALDRFVRTEQDAGHTVLPGREDVLRALRVPLDDVRVVIVGQDPYPTPGHSMGLAFGVRPEVHPLPRSLANIVTELVDDVGGPRPTSGDLSAWADQGVLLLNRCLTVRAGVPGSHRRRGWEEVTTAVLRHVGAREAPLVAVLWGNDARGTAPLLGSTPVIASVHPSPLSARRGFFGSRPFSRCNTLLVEQGTDPVDWRLAP